MVFAVFFHRKFTAFSPFCRKRAKRGEIIPGAAYSFLNRSCYFRRRNPGKAEKFPEKTVNPLRAPVLFCGKHHMKIGMEFAIISLRITLYARRQKRKFRGCGDLPIF